MRHWVMLAVALAAGGCQYARPACAVIDVAHYACQYVTVEYVGEDGTVRRQQVPVSEVRAMAVRAAALEGKAR